MIALEAFSELLSVLYSAPLDHENWGRVLDLLCRHTGTRTGMLLCANSRIGLSVQAYGGARMDSALLEMYAVKYGTKDPFRLPLLQTSRTGFIDGNELLSDEAMLQSEMYQHLNRPLGLRYPAVILLTRSLHRLEVISFWRTPEEGPMGPDSKHLLELLIPHIHIALEMSRKLGVAQQRIADAEAISDANATATFLLTGLGRVEHANAAAHSLLQQGDGLTILNERLSPSDSTSRAAWTKLLQSAATPANSITDTQPHYALALDRPSGKAPFQLLAMPLPEAQRKSTRADLLLLVTNPDKPANFPDEVLRALFRFTPAETEVANGLLMGYSTEEIACLRHVSTGTVRQQIKAMMSKTGSGRQSEMIGRFMALPRSPQFG
jgi:DNA-binding CsgD family transcriptional regulator